MDVSGIIRSLMQHRLLSAVIIVVTALAGGYVYFGTPNSYSASADFAISDPPAYTKAATPEGLPAAVPTGGSSQAPNANNPYLGFPDASTLIGALLSRMGSDSQVKSLKAAGLTGAYDVVRSDAVAGGRLVSISVSTTTPDGALADVELVTTAMAAQLNQMQTTSGATDDYVYHMSVVTADDTATPEVSGKLRSVILVAILGLLALATGVSTADALRTGRSRRGAEPEPEPAATTAAPAVPLTAVPPTVVAQPAAAQSAAAQPVAAQSVAAQPVVAQPPLPQPVAVPASGAWSEPTRVTTSSAAESPVADIVVDTPAPSVAPAAHRRRQPDAAHVESHRPSPRANSADLAARRRASGTVTGRRRGVAPGGTHLRPPG